MLAFCAMSPVLAQNEAVNYDPEESSREYKIEISAPNAPYVRWHSLYSRDSISVTQSGRFICKFAYHYGKPMAIRLDSRIYSSSKLLHLEGALYELICNGRQYFRIDDYISIPKHGRKLRIKMEMYPAMNI